MKQPTTGYNVQRRPKKATESRMLQDDVATMINEHKLGRRGAGDTAEALARHIIIVVRERVLNEIESYARENIR